MTAKDKRGRTRGRKAIEQRNPRLLEEFCRAMVDGLTVDEAMASCGIDRKSYRVWLKRDPEAERRIAMARRKRKSEYMEELRRLAFNKLTAETPAGTGEVEPRDQIKALTWLAEKEFPMELGSRATLRIEQEPPAAMSIAAIKAELQEILEQIDEEGDTDGDSEG